MTTVIRRYSRGRKLVAMRDAQAGTSRYFHYDHQGTTQCLTDGQGNVTDRFAADAWGVEVKRTGGSLNRQWYIGNSGWRKASEHNRVYAHSSHLLTPLGVWLSSIAGAPRSLYQSSSGNPYLANAGMPTRGVLSIPALYQASITASAQGKPEGARAMAAGVPACGSSPNTPCYPKMRSNGCRVTGGCGGREAS